MNAFSSCYAVSPQATAYNANFKTFSFTYLFVKGKFFTRSSIYFFILQPCCTRVWFAGYIEFHFFYIFNEKLYFNVKRGFFHEKGGYFSRCFETVKGKFLCLGSCKKYLKCVNREENFHLNKHLRISFLLTFEDINGKVCEIFKLFSINIFLNNFSAS